ncbi:hemolysin-III family protein [Plectosphaerella cucumerina]|uniref:Hemolysin-III family protein n=1 Tax=Plectosphaerella cucumerina TaxID=40658 RepID=A0A8K0X228_9PEZI|nr:hemolysin-III family protein [Plectosphaerella cucumerina]
MEPLANMAAMSSSTYACTVQDDEVVGVSSGSQLDAGDVKRRRRRHSFFLPRRKSIVGHIMDTEEGLLLRVDLFLSELERRLDFIESYGDLRLDSSIARAFATLQAVRNRCSQASEEVLGEGRRRLHVMVETLEARYQEGLASAESLNEKARLGIELLDDMLSDFEARAYKLREQGLATAAADAAGAFMNEGRRVVDQSIRRAHEVVDEGLERARRAAESLEERIQHAISRAKETGLIVYDDLPVPWRVNPHIIRGYRFRESKIDCVKSAFGISNEFVNIWSHAIGLVIVLAVALYFYPRNVNFHLSTKTDIFIAAVFFFTACLTLVCSTIWHTMNAVADVDAISIFACVDYTGISLLIAASIVTTEYTAFYCDPVSRWAYMSVTAILGIGGVIMPWHPTFNKADMAWARVAFFVGLGATGFSPMIQLYFTHGPDFVLAFYKPIAQSIAVYLAGALVYASHVPERWWPGVFDYVGGSHNLWHFAVLGGILFHYNAMQAFFTDAFRRAEGECSMY